MNFRLKTTGSCYSADSAARLEKLGFVFTTRSHPKRPFVMVTAEEPRIEIGSLEDLLAFANTWGNLVISVNPPAPTLEIYDSWRE